MQHFDVKQGDCLELMKEIPKKSVDLILCDLPYGTTDAPWDKVIDFNSLWNEYDRILKPDGVSCLFSAQPFTTRVINSNKKHFKYCWYWLKNNKTGFAYARYQPMRQLEEICVFYKVAGRYKPQGLKPFKGSQRNGKHNCELYTMRGKKTPTKYTNYPTHILNFKSVSTNERVHATQKPVDLLKYLIRTYTKEGETVLDNCMGSGSTGVATLETKRKFIGFEKEEKYFNIALKRLSEVGEENVDKGKENIYA